METFLIPLVTHWALITPTSDAMSVKEKYVTLSEMLFRTPKSFDDNRNL